MIERTDLKVAGNLARFLDEEALPGTGIEASAFWRGMADIYARFADENAALLNEHDRLQAEIDAWHDARSGQSIERGEYQVFLHEMGYVVAEPSPCTIAPTNIDDGLSCIAGLQLVVPILNARGKGEDRPVGC